MIPVRVGEDHVGDRRGRAPTQGVDCGASGGLRGAGVDGHDARVGQHEADVGEVVTLRDVDPGRHLDETWWPEAKAVPRGHREIRRELGQRRVQRRIPGLGEGGLGLVSALEGRERPREAPVDAAPEAGRQSVPLLEHPLELRHRLLRSAEAGGKLGQGHATQVTRHRMTGVRRAIELGDAVLDPGDPAKQEHLAGHPDLERPLQGSEDRLVWRGRRPLAEVAVSLLIAPGGEVLTGQGQDCRDGRGRPAHDLLQGLERAVGPEAAFGARGPPRCLARVREVR